jgi:hypothetical protein
VEADTEVEADAVPEPAPLPAPPWVTAETDPHDVKVEASGRQPEADAGWWAKQLGSPLEAA